MNLAQGDMKPLFILASLALAACDVGVFGPDGAMSGGDDTVCANRAATPVTAHVHTAAGGGGTNAGNSCIEVNCHSSALGLGPNAPPYQFGGTLYNADGTTPNAGAIVRVNAGGTIAMATTDTAGNFFIPDLMLATPFPSQTSATACPSLIHMVGTLQAGQGSCNGGAAGACHDTARRMTLQ
jgi:hypothetical protein